jgi:hypothetical protein
MELTDEQYLPLPRERVWAALNDPSILQASVPGCESLERVEENQFKVVLAATVGPIKARFNGRLQLTDLRAPESYSINFEGSGGAAGACKGNAKVTLQSEGAGTKLIYQTNAQVSGRLAQIGSRLIDGVAKKMAGEFFTRFTAAAMAGEPAAQAEPQPAMQPGKQPELKLAAATAGNSPASGGGVRNWWWVLVVVVAAIAVAAYKTH